jgi:uncharacterized LabA/DUF88 family protein
MNNSNSIALAESYLPLLDEVYKVASKTAVLDGLTDNVSFLNANQVNIFKTSMDGLGNYSRNSGFVSGDVTATWETMTLTKDRGRSLFVDRMDNEETINMAFGTLVGEFIRTKVVPEIDAYRFSKYVTAAGIDQSATLDKTTIEAAIDTGVAYQGEKEVPMEGKFLFITPTKYSELKQGSGVTRFAMMSDTNLNRDFEIFDGMRVVQVPQTRFYSSIDLYDGTTGGQEAGGYVKGATAADINFMIIHPSAVVQAVKHQLPRIFSPDVHQDADSWKFDYRIYHDAFVYENKLDGIYTHAAPTV